MTDINGQIDVLLAEMRPDRYEVEGGDEWLDEVADLIEGDIPAAEARARLARTLVRRREGDKTRYANRLLREIHESRQLPLDWLDTLNLPIAVEKERVTLRAAMAEDFRRFANHERRVAANDFAARNETCEAAEWLADMMDVTGTQFARDLRVDESDEAA